MPPDRGDDFWQAFEDDRSDGIIYGDIPDEFHRTYEDVVSESSVYESLSDDEKLILADDWADMFIDGGYRLGDMESWFDLLGIDIDVLYDTEYSALYDSLYG